MLFFTWNSFIRLDQINQIPLVTKFIKSFIYLGDRTCNYTLKFMSLSYKKLNKKQTKQTKIQNKAKQKKTKTEN